MNKTTWLWVFVLASWVIILTLMTIVYQNEKTVKALEDRIDRQTETQKWVYLEVCNLNEERAEPCVINPAIWDK